MPRNCFVGREDFISRTKTMAYEAMSETDKYILDDATKKRGVSREEKSATSLQQ